MKSGIKIKKVELSKKTEESNESDVPSEPSLVSSTFQDTSVLVQSSDGIIDYDPSVDWTEPFKIEIDEIDKYKILAYSAKEQKERELISNPIIQRFKELLKQELDKALSSSPSFMKAREQKDQAIRDFMVKNYKDLPKNVLISRVFVEEGYAECVDNQEEADKVRKLIGA